MSLFQGGEKRKKGAKGGPASYGKPVPGSPTLGLFIISPWQPLDAWGAGICGF